MAGLEVGHLRLVTSLHQGLEAGVDQLAHAAAQDSLLTEQVGLSLLLEGGLQNTGAAGADAGGIGQGHILGLAGEVLLHADQAGHALALQILAADGVAGALGGDHDDIHIGGRHNGLEVDVEAVGEGQRLALGHIGSHLLVVDISTQLVGHQHHDNVAGLGGLFHFHHVEIGAGLGKLGCLFPVGRALAQADHHVDAGLGQVFGMSVALGTKTDDGDGLAVQHAEIAVGIVILLDSHNLCSPLSFFVFLGGKVSWGPPRGRRIADNKKGFRLFSRRDESLDFRGTTLVGTFVPTSGISSVP